MQAIQEGRQKCLLWWERRALEMARGEPGNTQIVILGLKNRSRAAHGWHHDAQRLEHSGPDGAPLAIEAPASNALDVKSMSPEDRDALKGILLRAKARSEEQGRISQSED